MKIVLFLILFGFCVFPTAAQRLITDDGDIQSWNDAQLTVPMSKRFDFYTALTARLGSGASRLNDARIAVGFIWKPTKSVSISPFYLNVNAANSSGQFRQERQMVLRGVYRFPLKKFGLSHRSQYEYQMRFPRNS